jgi:hypothetical protein
MTLAKPKDLTDCIPLYTHPAKTLTDAELASLIKETHKSMGVNNCTTFDFIKAFLKKAQEK